MQRGLAVAWQTLAARFSAACATLPAAEARRCGGRHIGRACARSLLCFGECKDAGCLPWPSHSICGAARRASVLLLECSKRTSHGSHGELGGRGCHGDLDSSASPRGQCAHKTAGMHVSGGGVLLGSVPSTL